jgi:hypothetical protein
VPVSTDCARVKSPTKSKFTTVPFGSDPAGTVTLTELLEFELVNVEFEALLAVVVPIRVKAEGANP